MDYRKEVAAIAVIDTKAFELEKLAQDVGEDTVSTFGQLVQWIAYGNIGSIKNTMGTEKARSWLTWSIRYGEGLQSMIRAMEKDVDAERFNSVVLIEEEEDGLMAFEFRFYVTIH